MSSGTPLKSRRHSCKIVVYLPHAIRKLRTATRPRRILVRDRARLLGHLGPPAFHQREGEAGHSARGRNGGGYAGGTGTVTGRAHPPRVGKAGAGGDRRRRILRGGTEPERPGGIARTPRAFQHSPRKRRDVGNRTGPVGPAADRSEERRVGKECR